MADVPVNDEVPSIVVDVVSNGQTVFDYDFRADEVGDLRAQYRYANGDVLDFVGGVDFVASGLGTAAGGTVTLATFTATIAGDKLAIYRSIAIKRETDYSRDLFADDLNQEQDTLFMICQELRRDVDRSVKVGVGEDPITIEQGTSGQVPVYDVNGNLIPATPAPGLGNMMSEVYDPGSLGGDVFDSANHKAFTTSSIAAKIIPAAVIGFATLGFLSVGDGGGAEFYSIPAPGVVEPWHYQSANGRWFQVAKQRLDVRMFGAKIDAATDDAPAINAGIRLSALYGVEVFQPAGVFMQGSTITLKDGSAWVGFNYLSICRKLPTFNGVAVQSENFAALTGTGDAFAANVPERVCMKYITVDGNYQNTARNAYVQSGGQGIQIFARKVQIFARVFNMQGVGAWLECPGGNGPVPLQPGFSREAEIILYIHQTQYEGLVFKGPPDVRLDWVLQADAGSRIIADQENGKVNSPTYGAVNGAQTFGVVFDGKGAEVGDVHTFGNYGGGGIDWRNGGRVNANLLMAESCLFGGIRISGQAEGTINNLDVHRTGGFLGDSTPDLLYEGVGGNNKGVEISVLTCYRKDAAHLGARNGVHITGDFINIGILQVDLGSTATAGHGLYIDNDTAQWISINGGEIARCKGAAADGLSSAGLYRKTAGNGSMVKVVANIRDCDVAFRSIGTPRAEKIDLQFFLNAGQLPFAGDARTQVAQRWDISGVVDGVQKSSKFLGITAAFVSNNTNKQSLTVAHNLIYAPPFGKYHPTGIFDTATSLVDGDVAFFQTVSADATNVTVEFKMATANSVDTAPRIGVIAEI